MSERWGIDTNILIRLATGDDRAQAETVKRVMARLPEGDVLYINIPVLLESVWVLKRIYGVAQANMLDFLQGLLERRDLEVASYEAVGGALMLCRQSNVDFADALLSELNLLEGCRTTFTFDKKAAARISGMELLS